MTTLPPNRLQRAEHYCVAYAVELPNGHTIDDALDPAYWAHKGHELKPQDTIRLIPEDGSYYALAIVLQSGRGFAKLKMLHHVPYDEDVEEATSDDIIVKWGSPHLKFVVIRKADNERLKTGFEKKADAIRWAADYASTMAR